jgi:rare lipoprotein A
MDTGCIHRKKIQVAKPPSIGASEEGIASWYGNPYHGRRAANGEIYDMEKLTAAHRTLPFETWVRVKNLTNDKVIDVRIQDRGPFINGRIIDLSRAAARAIDLIGPGTARVRVTIIRAPEYTQVPPPPPEPVPPVVAAEPERPAVFEPELYAVQVGAYQDVTRAEAVRDAMRERYGSARLVFRPGKPAVWRVLVGEEDSVEAANDLASRLRAENGSVFVVRLDNPAPAPPMQ